MKIAHKVYDEAVMFGYASWLLVSYWAGWSTGKVIGWSTKLLEAS